MNKHDRNENDFKKENIRLQIDKKNQIKTVNDEYYKKLGLIRDKYGVEPKKKRKATVKELSDIIKIILETGKSGLTAKKEYALNIKKDSSWANEVAKHKTDKNFEEALDSFKDHEIIKAMIEHDIYCKKNILNNTVAGALKQLHNQLKYFRKLDDSLEEKARLREMLFMKESHEKTTKIDWQEAQRLRDNGYTVREVAIILGVSSSGVNKYTKKAVISLKRSEK